jgi:hypothetical protein
MCIGEQGYGYAYREPQVQWANGYGRRPLPLVDGWLRSCPAILFWDLVVEAEVEETTGPRRLTD